MDNIMDKLTEKISAQDIIKANSQAEVETAINDANDALLGKMEDSFNKKLEESNTKTHDVGVQTYRNVQAILNKQQEKAEEQAKELNSKIEAIQFAVETKNSALLPLLIITLIVAGADLCINILRILGIL